MPEIAFTGDTTADFLDSNCPVVADALRARVLLMELTFLDDVEVDEARGKGHMHIADFVANAHKFQVRHAGGLWRDKGVCCGWEGVGRMGLWPHK